MSALFSQSIPDRILENPNASQFVQVLDALQLEKQKILADSLRVYNPALYTDNKWLLKRLDDYGVRDLPMEYPFQCLQQYLLNAGKIFALRGSTLGLQLWVNVLCLGECDVVATNMYNEPQYIVLDDLAAGFLCSDNDFPRYIVSDSLELNPTGSLSITIKSRFFNGQYPQQATIIKEYIQAHIKDFLGFTPNITINITWQSRSTFFYHSELNQYFV